MAGISAEIVAAVIGATLGCLLTGIVSFVLHMRSLRHERSLARERMDWEFLSTTLPVLSKLFAKTTPDRIKSEADVFLITDDVYSALREGTFRGVFTGTSDTAPISGNVQSYTEHLGRYVRGEITREELENHRRQAIEEVSLHWKEIFPIR